VSAPDVVVVGGGVLGCAAALELTRRGAAVTVVERDSIGSHSSGFAYGGLFVMSGAGIPGPVLEPAMQASERHRTLAGELRDIADIDVQLRPAGTLTLAADAEELETLQAEYEWQHAEGLDTEVLSPSDVARLEPMVERDVAGALIERSHQELDSYRFTLALATALEKLGGVVRHGDVTGLLRNGSRVSGVQTASGDEIAAGATILATGPWAGSDEHPDLPRFPIRPVKGQILHLRFPGGGFDHRVMLGGYYVRRKPDGLVWAGTTEEKTGFDDRPSESGRASIIEGALRIAASLEHATVEEHTACLRPVSDDGLPVIGAVAETDGLFVLNGAGRKGIFLSPVFADMLAPVVLGETGASTAPVDFSPARFGL